MGRLQIDINGKKLGEYKFPVRITDINYGNHTGNDKLVGLIHEARVQWIQQMGFTELNIGGVGLIMSDICVQFIKESFYGDNLTFQIFADEVQRSSFVLVYQVTVHNVMVAKAKTSMVCYDYESSKIAAIPERFKSIIS